jgi:hypothetical protein
MMLIHGHNVINANNGEKLEKALEKTKNSYAKMHEKNVM